MDKMKKRKLIIISGASILAVVIIVAVVLALRMWQQRAETQRMDNIEIEKLSKRFGRDEEYIKEKKTNY